MPTKILITGSNGQLGSELRALTAAYPAWDFTFSDIADLDITNAKHVNDFVYNKKPQFIINCAAYTAVDKAESEPQQASSINAEAVENLAQAARQHDAYFVHISTDYVFDGANHVPYRENDAPNPQTIYGSTKLAGERLALAYAKTLVIRTAWLYSSFGSNFVKTMLRLGSQRSAISVVADQVGTPTYAADLADAILRVIDAINSDKTRFHSGIFHYTNEGICTWYDFAIAIMRHAGLSCKVIPVDTAEYPTAARRPQYSVLHKGRIKQCYAIAIRHWQQALEECMAKLN
jgi:dTDP-4-dehydrorhamnose reductase